MPSLVLLGAERGTSQQEALSLKWNDIDFDCQDRGLIDFYRPKMALGYQSDYPARDASLSMTFRPFLR